MIAQQIHETDIARLKALQASYTNSRPNKKGALAAMVLFLLALAMAIAVYI